MQRTDRSLLFSLPVVAKIGTRGSGDLFFAFLVKKGM